MAGNNNAADVADDAAPGIEEARNEAKRACEAYDLSLLMSLAQQHAFSVQDASCIMYWACSYDNLEAAMWVANHYQLTSDIVVQNGFFEDALMSACVNCHLRVADWLVGRFPNAPLVWGAAAWTHACEFGNLDVLKWLAVWAPPDSLSHIARYRRVAEAQGQGHVAEWLDHHFA